MRKPTYLLMSGLFYLLFGSIASAQGTLDLELVEKELNYQLNQWREKNALPLFQRSESLDAVAFYQAEYVAEKGRIIHEQEKESKKTLMDRIIHYEALNAEAGENIAMIAPNSKAAVEKGGEKIVLANEELVAKAAIYSWIEDEDSWLNLSDPNFYEIGFGIHESERKEIILVAILASLPYQVPEKVKMKFNFRGVESYDANKCKKFDENFGTAPELFSDAFVVEGNELYFQYHNKKLIEQLLENSNDALSAEIIMRSQFQCGESNRLFPGEITNGYMMHLLKKGSIVNLNLAQKENEVKLLIGEIPQAYLNADYEINGMVISENTKCATIPYNKFEVENLRWLNLPYQLVRSGVDSIDIWKDTLELKFYAADETELQTEMKEYRSMLDQLDMRIEKVEFKLHLAPSVPEDRFDGFVRSISDYFALAYDSTNDEVEPSVNWDAFDQFKLNTFYEIETKGMDRMAQAKYLQDHLINNQELQRFVKQNTFVELKVITTMQPSAIEGNEQMIDLYHFARRQKRSGLSLYFLNRLIEDERTELKKLLKEKEELEQKKGELELINNLIVAAVREGEVIYDGNPISTAFMELHLIDKSVPMIRYNYLVATLKDWADRRTKVSNPKAWEESFNKLKLWIKPELYARSMLNFQMIMADYYYEQQNAKEREDAFKSVMSFLPQSDLNNEELLRMAKYLAYQDQSSLALKSLLPVLNNEDLPEEHLFYFLQLAIYDEEVAPRSVYLDKMKLAANKYPDRFCRFFTAKQMGIQPLADYELKELYCSQCEN